MAYQFQVHKKVEFSREERIKAGKNPARETIKDVFYWISLAITFLFYFFMVIVFPIAIVVSVGDYRFLVVYIFPMLLFTAMGVLTATTQRAKNLTLVLSETEARVLVDSFWRKGSLKTVVSYDRVCKVYHTDICPVWLKPSARENSWRYDQELWYMYNGSYIVAEDHNEEPVFGVVYNEELWQLLKGYCKNATFFTKEEYLADLEKKRALDREHDAYSKTYDGYVN